MTPQLRRLLSEQCQVVGRRQALAAGMAAPDVRRLLRRRDWVQLHPGVYLGHTGEPSWIQRAWGAVLLTAPSALHGVSALRAADGPGAPYAVDGPIHVAVDRDRSGLHEHDGVAVHRVPRFGQQVQWGTQPPRQRYDEAALDVAMAAPTDLDAIGALAKAYQTRRTTPARLRETLAQRPRVERRDWLDGVLRDLDQGTASVLEHAYLTLVERAHGLPPGLRQARVTAGTGEIYRDAMHGRTCVVELDGRLFHDSAEQRDSDLERDLDAAVDGLSTARLGWGQVVGRPCATTLKVVRLLQRHRIEVCPEPCEPGCPVAAVWVA